MHELRCPNMDLLRNRLIEAYRRLGDTDTFDGSADEYNKVQREMAAVQHTIANHRQDCFLCQTLLGRQETLKAFAVDEPVWRGTMAS
jgi:hypothetical protein